MSLFRNAVSVLAVSALGIPVGIVTSIVLARFLSVEDRGSYSVVIAFVGLVTLFSQFGWSTASIYRLRRVGSRPGEVASAALVAMFVFSLAALGISLLIRDWLWIRFFPGVPAEIFSLALAIIPFQLMGVVFSGIARGIDRFGIANAYQLSLNTGTLLLLFVALVILRGSLVQAIAAYLAVHVLATSGLLVAVLRQTGLSSRVELSELRASLSFGIRSYIQSLAGQLHERIDVFMIAYFLADPTQVAFYAVAAGVIQRLKLFPEALGKALFPQLAGTREQDMGGLTGRVLRHSILWVGLCAGGLGLAAPLLIPLLYGQDYERSIAPFLLLLPGMALLTIYRVLARYFVALGRQRINIQSQLLSLSVNVGLNVLLIPRYGIVGAAFSSLVSYGLESFLITVAFRAQSGQALNEIFVFRKGDMEPYRRRLEPLLRRFGRS